MELYSINIVACRSYGERSVAEMIGITEGEFMCAFRNNLVIEGVSLPHWGLRSNGVKTYAKRLDIH